MFSLHAILALWLAWLAYWAAVSRRVKAARWEEPVWSRLVYTAPLLVGVILLFGPRGTPAWLTARVLPRTGTIPLLAVVVVAAGLGFAVWARIHLGTNWSGNVTLKENHTLIRSGPYRFVRHPIYTGLIVAFFGTALSIGEVRGILATALAFLSFWYKSRIEEGRMLATFPEYEDYRRRTAALIPFIF